MEKGEGFFIGRKPLKLAKINQTTKYMSRGLSYCFSIGLSIGFKAFSFYDCYGLVRKMHLDEV